MSARVPYLLVSLAFIASRVALWRAGLPFVFKLDWMWLADTADLRDRLAETLWYFHAFPPGMDLLTGLLLKAAGDGAGTLAAVAFHAAGLVLANALVAVGLALGLRPWASAGLATGFLLIPPTIYFEHLFLYEWVVVTLLVVSAVCFHRACLQPTALRWALFFAVCAALAITRSTFHLIWFFAMMAGALMVAGRDRRRAAIAGALPGLLIVLAVYGKNAAVFGEFAASTFGPAAFHLVTVGRMNGHERHRWIADGRLSRFAAIDAYAPPLAYAGLFVSSAAPRWPAQLTRLTNVTAGAPNFNHWFILEAHRARRKDVAAYLRAEPLGYLRNVSAGVIALLGPSTEWHPRTGTPESPHTGHRAVLGGYEAAFNTVLHRWPAAPVGVYVVLPVVVLVSAWLAWRLWHAEPFDRRVRGALIAFCVFQVVYVVTISSALTFLESSRYRFQVEPFIWLLAAVLISHRHLYGRLPHRRHV